LEYKRIDNDLSLNLKDLMLKENHVRGRKNMRFIGIEEGSGERLSSLGSNSEMTQRL
jgi:hypothetical protein